MKKWQIALIGILIVLGLFLLDGGSVYIKQLINRPPRAIFTHRTPTRTLRYIAPTDRDRILLLNNSTDPDGDPLTGQWFIRYNGTGEWKLLNSSAHHWGRLPVSSEKGHEVKLVASDGMKEDSATAVIPVDPAYWPQYPAKKSGIPVKGMIYNTGITRLGTGTSYPTPPREQMEEELEVIKNELGCNAIRLSGDDDAMLQAAHIALRKDFTVIGLSPCYEDATVEETERLFNDFVRKMGDLARNDRILLMVGNELTLECIGWSNATTYEERVKDWEARRQNQDRLNELLRSLLDCVPNHFRGKTTYARGCWEEVDWRKLDFDIVGSNEYWWDNDYPEKYVERLRQLRAYGKPLYITEFGSCTFKSALVSTYREAEGKEYSQEAQASYIEHYLRLFNTGQVDGCFVYIFNDRKPDPRATFRLFEGVRRKLAFYLYRSYLVEV